MASTEWQTPERTAEFEPPASRVEDGDRWTGPGFRFVRVDGVWVNEWAKILADLKPAE